MIDKHNQEKTKQEVVEILHQYAAVFAKMYSKLMPINGVYSRNIVKCATIYLVAQEYIRITLSDIDKILPLIRENEFASLTSRQIAYEIAKQAQRYATEDIEKNIDKYLKEGAHRVH